MIRNYFIILALGGLWTLGGCNNTPGVTTNSATARHTILASADAPATQPTASEFPPGHPDVTSKPDQPAASLGSLPAGHPDISQMLKNPNSSGAADAAMPVGVNLPAGHPDLSKIKGPSSQPAASGSITIRAVQETTGGPAAGADDFSLELYVQSQLLDRIEGKLDSQATVIVRGIPLLAKAQPVIKVTHSGVVYQVSGEPIDEQNPSAQIQVPVYETTNQAPEWQIRMRHVMVSHAEGLVRVMEMLAIDNPTDRAWLGNP
ncbi:MAG TPA: hypothetical protein VHD56_06390, partial [Tepidisphaeraceae bacterium]|nr:hypothetical protein [Tepidisphaeraceae bacterium]